MTADTLYFVHLSWIAAFLVGACIGSFLNVCIARWPAELSIITPRSRCPKCERPIRAYENIPLLGWIMLRGRCAGCKAPISIQYPLVELIVALMWMWSVMQYGVTFGAVRIAVFLTVLLGIAVTDAKHYLIPDGFTLFGLAWMLGTAIVALFVHDTTPLATNLTPPLATTYNAFIGAFTGAGAIAIAGWLGEVMLKREAMGFGDVTLMAVAGAALGPNRTILTIFLGAAIGVVVFLGIVYPVVWMRAKLRQEEPTLPLVPFGVFLAPGAVVALFFGDPLIHWYTARVLGA